MVVMNNASTGSFASLHRSTRDGTSNRQQYTFKLNGEYIAFIVCIRYKVSGNPLRSIPETNSIVLNRETLYTQWCN